MNELSFTVPRWVWAAVTLLIGVMLAVDLIAHRDDHVIGFREAALWSAVCRAIGLGFGFGLILWAWQGGPRPTTPAT